MTVTIDGTTGLASIDGSASAPSVRGSDSNSGIAYAADSIKFSTGGTERVAISNTSYPRILQVIQTAKTDTASVSVNYANQADIGLSASITPVATSSKIFVKCSMMATTQNAFGLFIWLVRGSTNIMLADASGSRTRCSRYWSGYSEAASDNYKLEHIELDFLDSPSTTSSTTYKIQMGSWDGNPSYLNRCHNDNNSAAYDGNGVSTMTLMEVAG